MTWLEKFKQNYHSNSVYDITDDATAYENRIALRARIEPDEQHVLEHPPCVFSKYATLAPTRRNLNRWQKHAIFLHDAFFRLREEDREFLLVHHFFEHARIARRGVLAVPLQDLKRFTPLAREVLTEVEALRVFLHKTRARNKEYIRTSALAKHGIQMRYEELDTVIDSYTDKYFIAGYRKVLQRETVFTDPWAR